VKWTLACKSSDSCSGIWKINQCIQELHLSTPSERFHVRWDEGGNAIAMRQFAFFAEFWGLLAYFPVGWLAVH